METIRLTTGKGDIGRAGEIIRRGGLVAFPTETVYGLGANALDEEAVRSVYKAKDRPSDNPMIVHIADLSALDALTEGGMGSLPQTALVAAARLWPGPLTMVFRKSAAVPFATTGGLDTIAVRMPANGTARSLIRAAATPIAAPSANISGRPSPTTASDVLEDMDGRIDAVIMGERCDIGIESTVLDMTGASPIILRPGMYSREYLSKALAADIRYDSSLFFDNGNQVDPADGVSNTDFKPRSPGMKYRHYAPKAELILVEGDSDGFERKTSDLISQAESRGKKAAVLDYGDRPELAAHDFFADIRELDRQGYDLILVKALERKGQGFSVMNRMLKSAGCRVIK